MAQAIDRGASDLHLVPAYPPTLRLHGTLVEHDDPPLAADEVRALLTALCPATARGRFLAEKSHDFSFVLPHGTRHTRFRVNLFHAGGAIRACPRVAGSVVTQREVGRDVLSFADGLRAGLRQAPDAILVGEVRDRETAQIDLSAAETGHLVFSTLHARDAKGAVTRLADLFPQEAQRDVRSQLALGLRAVVAQRLLPDVLPGEKRHLALEVMWNTYPIASAIRTGKLESIDNYLVTGRNEGMVGFDEAVRVLLRDGKISREVADQNSRAPTFLPR